MSMSTGGSQHTASGPLRGTPAAWPNVNTNLIKTILTAYLCPSDDISGGLTTTDAQHYLLDNAGRTNYLPCGGSRGWTTNPSWALNGGTTRTLLDGSTGVPDRGMFGFNSSASIRDLTDGTSNSLAFGEARQKPGSDTIRGIETNHAAAWGAYTWVSNFIAVHPNSADPNHIDHARYHINGPRDVNGMTGSTVDRVRHHGGTASSAHTGGAQFLLGDGSVKFLTENMDKSLYARLNYISDGAPVGEF